MILVLAKRRVCYCQTLKDCNGTIIFNFINLEKSLVGILVNNMIIPSGLIKYRLKIIKAIYPSNPYLKLFIKFYYKFLSAVR